MQYIFKLHDILNYVNIITYTKGGTIKLKQIALKDKKSIYTLGLILIAIIWGFAFIAIKFTVGSIPPFYTIGFRFSIASLVLILLYLKNLKNITKEELIAGIILGICAYIGYLAQNIGLEFTTASNSSFLSVTDVVMVPFLYWAINKTRPDIYQILAGIIVMIGVGLLSLTSDFTIGFGDLITLLAAFGFSMHMIFIDKYTEKFNVMTLVVVQITTCAILGLITAFIKEGVYDFSRLNRLSIFGILFLGIISTLITLSLQNICQKYVKPVNASLILSSQTIFATFFAITILKETLTLKMCFGCLLILAGIIICQTKPNLFKCIGYLTKKEVDYGNWTKNND